MIDNNYLSRTLPPPARSFPQSEEFRRRLCETVRQSELLRSSMKSVLTSMRLRNSRLYFLSDENLVDIIRLANPNTNPLLLLNKLILPLFRGVKELKISASSLDHATKIDAEIFHLDSYSSEVSIDAIVNQLDESLAFPTKLSFNWLSGVEAALTVQRNLESSIRSTIKG